MCTGAQTKNVHSKICDLLLDITPNDHDIIDPSRLRGEQHCELTRKPPRRPVLPAPCFLPRLCDLRFVQTDEPARRRT